MAKITSKTMRDVSNEGVGKNEKKATEKLPSKIFSREEKSVRKSADKAKLQLGQDDENIKKAKKSVPEKGTGNIRRSVSAGAIKRPLKKPASSAAAEANAAAARSRIADSDRVAAQKKSLLETMTKAVSFNQLVIVVGTNNPAAIKRAQPLFDAMADMHHEMKVLMNMIAGLAVLPKSSAPSDGPQSLPGLKQRLIDVLREACDDAIRDDFDGDDAKQLISDFQQLLDTITHTDAKPEVKNKNMRAPDYIPPPPKKS